MPNKVANMKESLAVREILYAKEKDLKCTNSPEEIHVPF